MNRVRFRSNYSYVKHRRDCTWCVGSVVIFGSIGDGAGTTSGGTVWGMCMGTTPGATPVRSARLVCQGDPYTHAVWEVEPAPPGDREVAFQSAATADWTLLQLYADWLEEHPDRAEDAARLRQRYASRKEAHDVRVAWLAQFGPMVELVAAHGGHCWQPSGLYTYMGPDLEKGTLCEIPEGRKSDFCRAAHKAGIRVDKYTHGPNNYCYRLTWWPHGRPPACP